MVEAVAVVVEAGIGVEILCGETERECICEWAALRDCVAEGVVGVACNGVAVCVEIARDVAVVVVERNIELVSGGVRSGGVADSEVEESSDTPSALQSSGNVFAPIVANRRRRAVRVGDALFYEVPVIVEKGCRRFLCDLLDTLVAYMPTR